MGRVHHGAVATTTKELRAILHASLLGGDNYMPMCIPPTFVALIVLLNGISIAWAQQKNEVSFPTNDEVRLVLTQTERALQQYKPLLDEEEHLFGENGKEAAAKDREVVAALDMAIKAFRQKPQGFNGPLGFAFFEWIDDSDRNVLLCASGASNDAVVSMINGEKSRSDSLMKLSQRCMDLSTLLYTVSENASALYMRYAEAEEQTAIEAADVGTKCVEELKKSEAAKRKQ